MNTDTATRTRSQAADALDDLRDSLVHSATCEMPGDAKCDACDTAYQIGRVIRDLDEGDALEDVVHTARHYGMAMDYDVDRQVRRIVATMAE
jgi:hypothetical protein